MNCEVFLKNSQKYNCLKRFIADLSHMVMFICSQRWQLQCMSFVLVESQGFFLSGHSSIKIKSKLKTLDFLAQAKLTDLKDKVRLG